MSNYYNPECIECGLLKSTTEAMISPLCSRAKLAGGSHNFGKLHNPESEKPCACAGERDRNHTLCKKCEGKKESWRDRIKKTGWYPHLQTMGERSLEEFLCTIEEEIDKARNN